MQENQQGGKRRAKASRMLRCMDNRSAPHTLGSLVLRPAGTLAPLGLVRPWRLSPRSDPTPGSCRPGLLRVPTRRAGGQLLSGCSRAAGA